VGRAPPGATFLVGEHLAAMCSPDYAREAKRAGLPLRTPEDLKHHVLLYMHDAQRRWPWLTWAAWFEAMGVEDPTPAGALTFDQYDQVVQGALHGQGVALGRMTLVRQHVRAKRLILLFGRQQQLARGYHAVYARNPREQPEARRFVEWLRSEIDADA
jgi:DNA-binding transcriptional LysR family regulator